MCEAVEASRPANSRASQSIVLRAKRQRFPFQVAKCLDPELFRNVDFLNWREAAAEELRKGNLILPMIGSGLRCVVTIGVKRHSGFIRSIDSRAQTAQVSFAVIGVRHDSSAVELGRQEHRLWCSKVTTGRHFHACFDSVDVTLHIRLPTMSASSDMSRLHVCRCSSTRSVRSVRCR